MEIEELPGVGSAIAKKLKEAGYYDLMALAVANPDAMAADAGIGEATAKKLVNLARSKLNMEFADGIDILKKQETMGRITTGSKALDSLIGGGVETQTITEAFGKYGSGKTQLAIQLAVNVQLPKEKGGLGGNCVFIDTENTFRPARVMQVAEAVGLDPKKVLKNIKVGRAYSSDHQLLLVEKIPELVQKDNLNLKIIIVDSLIALFRAEYVGRGTLADRQQKINRLMHALQRLADRYNAAVYVTNQVMARPDIFFGDPTTAVGGNVVGHTATYRLYLRKAKGTKRIARLIDSPSLPEGEAVFAVTEKGIVDVED
ncbi:DNA repair and recombination protein RadA [Nanoarchaeota archaeon]|nr:MAG: DNA repair and recombination protein RadA [Nanoarchaeota archaeon]